MITLTNPAAEESSFVQFRVVGDSAKFIGPLHSDTVAEVLSIKSLSPKRGNNQFGNRRSTVALTTGTSVIDLNGDTTVRDRKMAIEASIPVGTTLVQLTSDAHKLGALLQNATFVASVFANGIIEY